MSNLKKDEKNLLHFHDKTVNKRGKKQNNSAKKKKSYRVDFRMPDGRRVTKVFQRKVDSEMFKAQLKVEKQMFLTTGQVIKQDVTLEEFSKFGLKKQYMEEKHQKLHMVTNQV